MRRSLRSAIEASSYLVSGYLFIIFFLAYLIVYIVAELIPVNGGAGWDGSVYLEYIMRISQGREVVDDPYRLLRIFGFIPALFAAKAGLNSGEIVLFQVFFNAVLLSGAAACHYVVVSDLIGDKLRAVLVVMLMFFSWPYLVMPVYYPMLSDHLALAFSVFSIWAWYRQRVWVLLVLIFVATWVLPGLFLLPLFLIAFAVSDHKAISSGSSYSRGVLVAVAFVLLLCVGFLLNHFQSIPDSKVLAHPPREMLGIPELRLTSVIFLGVALSMCSVAFAGIFASSVFWAILSIKNILVGLIALGISILMMYLVLDWGRGFRGPPFLDNLILQALSAPAKPLIAHFLYFGPVFLAAMMVGFTVIFRACQDGSIFMVDARKKKLFILSVVFSAFFPILLLGSESRQWIYTFPVAVTIVASFEKRLRILVLFLICALTLIQPMFGLREAVLTAWSGGFSFETAEWQYYFSRQGPWMSIHSYIFGLYLANIFLLMYLLFVRVEWPWRHAFK